MGVFSPRAAVFLSPQAYGQEAFTVKAAFPARCRFSLSPGVRPRSLYGQSNTKEASAAGCQAFPSQATLVQWKARVVSPLATRVKILTKFCTIFVPSNFGLGANSSKENGQIAIQEMNNTDWTRLKWLLETLTVQRVICIIYVSLSNSISLAANKRLQ